MTPLERLQAEWRERAQTFTLMTTYEHSAEQAYQCHMCAYALQPHIEAERAKEASMEALLTSHAELVEALQAARQFLDPMVPRGEESKGWWNTGEMVEAALARAEALKGHPNDR